MPRQQMRLPSGPQRLCLGVGHDQALLEAVLFGGGRHIDAEFDPSISERLADLRNGVADVISGEARGGRRDSWAPEIPEWAEFGDRTSDGYTVVEGGAIIDISGSLFAKGWSSWWSETYHPGYRDYVRALETAQADPRVDFVFLRLDSPGGLTGGLWKAVDAFGELNAAAGEKPLVGHVERLCLSAAYALGAQCDALFAADGAEVGSIGVRMMLFDDSEWMKSRGFAIHPFKSGELKDMGAWWRPPTKKEKKLYQAGIDHAADRFFQAVARGRDIPIDAIREHNGWEAQVFLVEDPQPPAEINALRDDVALVDSLLDEEAAFRAAQVMVNRAGAKPLSSGTASSRAGQDLDLQAAGQTKEPTMAKLSAQLAALLAKEENGTITKAEAAQLDKMRALLAGGEGEGTPSSAEGEDDESEAEDEDDESEAEGEDDESEAEGEDDESEAEGEDDDDPQAAAEAVLASKEAKGRMQLAARLALRVASGRVTKKEALADLAAAPRASKLDDRMSSGRQGARPGAGASNTQESPLVAAAREQAESAKR